MRDWAILPTSGVRGMESLKQSSSRLIACRATEEEEPRATDCLAELLGAGTSPAADAPIPAERLTTALQLIEVLLVTAATAPHVSC